MQLFFEAAIMALPSEYEDGAMVPNTSSKTSNTKNNNSNSKALNNNRNKSSNVNHRSSNGNGKVNNKAKLRLYIAEEQQLLREAYQTFFIARPDMDVVGVTGDTSGDSLSKAAVTKKPDVMLLGIKILQPATVEKLEMIRESNRDVAIVLLSAYYDVKGITALRMFSRGAGTGCAYLMKHTIDTVQQLTQVVRSVAEGRVILDPTVMDGLIATGDAKATFLKDLTTRELEVLGWMAKGYRNATIAEVIFVDPKTVERHINNIYSKLGNCPESMHPRVHAIMLYMRATGQLPTEGTGEE